MWTIWQICKQFQTLHSFIEFLRKLNYSRLAWQKGKKRRTNEANKPIQIFPCFVTVMMKETTWLYVFFCGQMDLQLYQSWITCKIFFQAWCGLPSQNDDSSSSTKFFFPLFIILAASTSSFLSSLILFPLSVWWQATGESDLCSGAKASKMKMLPMIWLCSENSLPKEMWASFYSIGNLMLQILTHFPRDFFRSWKCLWWWF